jgi:hypothetical protein
LTASDCSIELCASRDKQEELPDSIIDSIARFHQRLNKWQKLEELNIAKEYVDGHIAVLIELNREPRHQGQYSRTAVWPHARSAICHRHGNAAIWVNDFQMPDSGHASNGSEKGVRMVVALDKRVRK